MNYNGEIIALIVTAYIFENSERVSELTYCVHRTYTNKLCIKFLVFNSRCTLAIALDLFITYLDAYGYACAQLPLLVMAYIEKSPQVT